MMNSINCLNQDCLDLNGQYQNAVNLTNRKINVEEESFNLCNRFLDWAVGKMYCDRYILPEEKVTDMIRETIGVYRNRMENCDWMSQATRDKAVEKLDGIRIHSVYPDDWTPYAYTGMDFKSKEEGGNSFTDLIAVQKFKRKQEIKNIVTPPEGDIWDGAPQDPDAHYSPTDNSINITAGVLGDAFYDPNASESGNPFRDDHSCGLAYLYPLHITAMRHSEPLRVSSCGLAPYTCLKRDRFIRASS